MDAETHERRNDAMADTDAVARPTTAPLATLATITVYERLVREKDAEIAALRAEIEQLGTWTRSRRGCGRRRR